MPSNKPVVHSAAWRKTPTVVIARDIIAGKSQPGGYQAAVRILRSVRRPFRDVTKPEYELGLHNHAAYVVWVCPPRQSVHSVNGRDQMLAVAIGLHVLIRPSKKGQCRFFGENLARGE
jgi:hypothetical protein